LHPISTQAAKVGIAHDSVAIRGRGDIERRCFLRPLLRQIGEIDQVQYAILVEIGHGADAQQKRRDELGHEPGARDIGMDAIGEQVSMVLQRRIQIEYGRIPQSRDLVDHGQNLVVNHGRTDREIHIERRHGPADPNLGRAGQRPEGIDHGDVVGDVFIPVNPVVGLRVVRPELDDHNVRVAGQGAAVGTLANIRLIPPAQQRGPADAEVVHLPGRVVLLENLLQLSRIAVVGSIGDARAIGDAVPDTRNPLGGGRTGNPDHNQDDK